MLNLDQVRALPKVDLHRHLDGDVRPEVIAELASSQKIPLPVPEENIGDFLSDLRKQGLVPLLQNGFGLITKLMQTEESLHKVAFEECRNLAQDNIIYAEIRFAPQYHTGNSEYYKHWKKSNLSYSQIIRAVRQGLQDGEKAFGVQTGLIICIGREAESDVGEHIANISASTKGVVALDLACDEATFPPERHEKAYISAATKGLNRTVHAGEFGNQQEKNIRTAIESLYAQRIGHAIPLSKNSDLVKIVLKNKVTVEMCPLSNLTCGWIQSYNELGIQDLLREHVNVTINSDDPAMFGYTLSDTLYDLVRTNTIRPGQIEVFQLNAMDGAFCDSKTRASVTRKIVESYHNSNL